MSWFHTANRFADPVGAKRVALFADLLSRFPPGHLIDLGAGHGRFSQIAVELGWRATAVDVRDERFPADSGISWVVSDIRKFDAYDDADLVVCLGLWYHLTAQDQRELARRVYPRPLILDTHVALRTVPKGRLQPRISPHLVRHGIDDGRLYDESEFERSPTASWGNTESFWPTLRSLEDQMLSAGYEIFEQISPPYLPDRGFFLARNLVRPQVEGGLDGLVRTFGSRETKPDTEPTVRSRSLHPAVKDWAAVGRPAAAPSAVPTSVAARQLGRALVRAGRRRARRLRSRISSS